MEIRLATPGDKAELKKLWKLGFGDEDLYIELYYTTRYKEEETAVLLLDGKLVAMLTMMPVHLVLADGSKISAAMIYGVCTHPDFRSRGLAGKLLQFAEEYLRINHVNMTMLVPASASLFDFYAKSGYQAEFYTREAKLTAEEIKNLTIKTNHDFVIDSIDTKEYNTVRQKQCKGSPHVSYEDRDIQFQKNISRLSGEDIFSIKTHKAKGCFAMERSSEDQVMIKELLMEEKLLVGALKEISKYAPAKEYIVRIPPFAVSDFKGELKPFGMLKIDDNSYTDLFQGKAGYLGLAFD